jgi:KDO2-lipid IV(A) lauroyltransferase|tara:strand:+ start:309 stop:1175 length:867 start_codon:yes stop_codon:yes gene_type:complete
MKIIKYFIESIFIYLFFIIIKLVNLKLGRKIFSNIFKFIGPKIRSKTLAQNNISISLGVYDKDKIEKIISSMWANYGMVFVEYLHLKQFRKQSSHLEIKGQKILHQIKKNNKPVIFISGHFANFELMSMEIIKSGISLATIYRPLNNIFVNPVMEYIRRKYVCEHQIQKGRSGTRKAINYIKNNYSIALMVDQRVSEGKQIPFFKRNALTTTLPAQIAIKFNLDIVPVYIKRTADNNFQIEFFEPIKTENIEDSEKEKINLTLKLSKFLENMISSDPEQWIWTHNRWK